MATNSDVQMTGQVALVTGAASTVGQAVTQVYRALGMRLVLADLHTDGLGQDNDLVVQADLTRADACADVVAQAVDRFGAIDILVNTQGIDPPSARTVLETSQDDWDRIINVNLGSVFQTCKATLEVMIAQGRGVIVNVASQGALLSMPSMAAYGTSKAAVLALTRAIATDHGKQGIRANCVCPSGLDLPSRDRLEGLDHDRLAQRRTTMENMSPLGDVCSPQDVADAILFLSGPQSRFITGAALPVEGGATMALRF